jgi:hypothetical protein
VERGRRQLADEFARLGLDLAGLLVQEPRGLFDADFLGALHLELQQRLGAEAAGDVLLRLGFVLGLADAQRVLRGGFAPLEPPHQGAASATNLAIRLATPRGLPEWTGAWPEAFEARAISAPADAPRCHASAGYTSGWLSGILDADVLALETSCRCAGAAECTFVAREASAWRVAGAPRASERLAALPFEALRQLVAQQRPEDAAPAAAGERYEPGSPVIHVWGPVMVLPFAGSDECLRSLDLLGRDPAARGVRVVVVDLSGALIDEGFGAASLELVLDAVEDWGAEPLLTGISPLSERAVATLEKTHLVIRKDLPFAIATAFQIAEAQRHNS